MAAHSRTALKVLLVVFIILTLVATIMLYYSHATPIEENSVLTLYEYGQNGIFNYSVLLKPNTFYNKTTLEKGEGTIFTKIARTINISLDYQWIVLAQEGTADTNITVRHSTTEYLVGGTWSRQIAATEQTTIEATGTEMETVVDNIPAVDVASVQNLIGNFSAETGMVISQYNVTIEVGLDITANTIHGQRNDSITPQLTMIFKSDYYGGYTVSMQGLVYGETGRITNTETIHRSDVEVQRYVSYFLSVISYPGLTILLWKSATTRSTKTKEPEALIKDLIEPFKEIISETDQEPRFGLDTAEISMKSLEDLAKVADTLMKPIIHARKQPDTHIFYVIDEATLYEFVITESKIVEMTEKREKERETE